MGCHHITSSLACKMCHAVKYGTLCAPMSLGPQCHSILPWTPCFPSRCPHLLLSSIELKFEHCYNFIFLYKLQPQHRLKAAGTNPPGTPECEVLAGSAQLNDHCGFRSQDKALSIIESQTLLGGETLQNLPLSGYSGKSLFRTGWV